MVLFPAEKRSRLCRWF